MHLVAQQFSALFPSPMPLVYTIDVLPDGTDAGKRISQAFASGGSGTHVFLRSGCKYSLRTPITITSDDCLLATEGYPACDPAKAVLLTTGDQADALVVRANGCRILNLVIDGLEPSLGRSRLSEPLVFIGGEGYQDCVVQDCSFQHPRGWTCLHLFDGGKGMRVLNNKIGPAGRPAPDGPWADGISVACKDGIIANNTIVDATDGAIVLFCAPGTLVVNNTIIARERNLLGAINLVDYGAFEGDYTNTRVFSNKIYSDRAYIKLGIGVGAACWGDWMEVTARGGFVEDNQFLSGRMGYAIGVAGCQDFTIRNNFVSSSVVFEGDMTNVPWNPAPCPFVCTNVAQSVSGLLQDGFRYAYIRFLIGVEDGLSSLLSFLPGNFHLDSSIKPALWLKTAQVRLSENGLLQILDYNGQTIWSSAVKDSNCAASTAVFTSDGHLQVCRKKDGSVIWERPSPAVSAPIADGSPCLNVTCTTPYLTIQDKEGSLLYAASCVFPLDFTLNSGCFVAIESRRGDAENIQEAPPLVTSYLLLEGTTSQLVLHSSQNPTQPSAETTHWRSPVWVDPSSDSSVSARAILQGDGNFVIYKGGTPIWASATNGHLDIAYIALRGHTHDQPARLELLDSNLKVKWTSAGHE